MQVSCQMTTFELKINSRSYNFCLFVDLFVFISNPNSIMLKISFNTFEQNKKK